MVTEEPFVVCIPEAIYNEMVEHILVGYPDEACGALGYKDRVVFKHYPTANAAPNPDDYSEIRPDVLLSISYDIEDNYDGKMIYYHSHPLTEAEPSPRDIEVARVGDYLYIIFSLRFHPEPPYARVFSIDSSGAVTEGKIEII